MSSALFFTLALTAGVAALTVLALAGLVLVLRPAPTRAGGEG